jgi:hypothetical protein
MLRIKEDVDLKKLKKFGFKEFPNGFFKKVYLANDDDDRVCYRIKEDREVEITRLDGQLDNTLYDLIQANLVEKVEE